MKRAFLLLLASLFFLGICSPTLAADYLPGEVIIKLRPEAIKIESAENYLKKTIKTLPPRLRKLSKDKKIKIRRLFSEERVGQLSGKPAGKKSLFKTIGLGRIYKISIPKDEDVLRFIEELQKDPNIEYAEPDYLVQACAITPDDTYYSNQWGPPKIQADVAWETITGSAEEVVAVIDTGVNYNHEDLTGKVILGHDYVNNDDDPIDDQGHGTHVAGIAAAIGNNSKGIAGTNWYAKILAIKVLNNATQATGSIANVALGIKEAADAGADIINLSLGGDASSSTLQDACTYAYTAGSVIAAAAGNSGSESYYYPAAYSNVIAVAATDQSDKRSVWSSSNSSNYGTWVDVAAPGTDIFSTNYSGTTTYSYKNGTSMATPFVAGLAALIKNKYPSWTPAQIMAKIESTTDNIDSLNPGYEGKLGTGRINAARALGGFLAYIRSPEEGSIISGVVPIRGYATGEGFTNYKLEYRQGTGTSGAWTQIGAAQTTAVSDGLLGTWTTIPNANGTYTLKLTVTTTVELTYSITVTLNNAPSIIGSSLGGPNPFSPAGGGQYTIYYNLATDASVSIYIFDLTGNLLWKKTEAQSAGPNYVTWNGKNAIGENLSNGVYLYRIVHESGGTQALLGKGKILILN